jgi:prepilin-type N-terminal cleavage/methylation domain-containing protein/prepilin-type processing-associated H-X9-DG protein
MTLRHESANEVRRRPGFTLVEITVTVAIIGLLTAALVPGLHKAREQSRLAVCGSNLRQLALANLAYAADQTGHLCPAAAGIAGSNLRRWHGTRNAEDGPFDPRRGPLVPYLGVDARIRACPSFRDFVVQSGAAFEQGTGGYGYNQAYVGQILQKRTNGAFAVVTTESGVQTERIRRPSETLMFTDTAFAAVRSGVIEYSFAEPRFHPAYLQYHARMDPSIHFRHQGVTSAAWCDGHVDTRRRSFTWRSTIYEGDPGREGLGWFGLPDDNAYFDLE